MTPVYELGPFRLEPSLGVLTRDGAREPLGARGVAVLNVLVEHANGYVSKAAINVLGVCLLNLAGVHTERAELDEALAAAREGLPLLQESESGLPWMPLDHLALRAALADKPGSAARIAGHADSVYAARNASRQPNEARARERLRSMLRDRLARAELERLLAEGAALSEDEACRLALHD